MIICVCATETYSWSATLSHKSKTRAVARPFLSDKTRRKTKRTENPARSPRSLYPAPCTRNVSKHGGEPQRSHRNIYSGHTRRYRKTFSGGRRESCFRPALASYENKEQNDVHLSEYPYVQDLDIRRKRDYAKTEKRDKK